jgi:hypothetical protein
MHFSHHIAKLMLAAVIDFWSPLLENKLRL